MGKARDRRRRANRRWERDNLTPDQRDMHQVVRAVRRLTLEFQDQHGQPLPPQLMEEVMPDAAP